MKVRKVVSIASDVDGRVDVNSLQEAKKIALANIKKGIRTSVYLDYYDTDEDIDPVKSDAWFTKDDFSGLYKSKY